MLQQIDRLIWEPGLSEPRTQRQPTALATHTVHEFSAQSQLLRGYQGLDTKLPTEYQFQKASESYTECQQVP